MSKTTDARRVRITPGRFAWIGLALVLAFLTAFSLWVAVTSQAAGNAVRTASAVDDAYERALTAVADEESLERKYRLEPSQDVRSRYLASAAALESALEAARAAGTASDARLEANVLGLHSTYLLAIERMFAAADAGDTARVLQIDGAEVDPLFAQIEELVTAAASRHHDAVAAELDNLGRTDTFMLAATPAILLLGFVFLLLFRTAFRGFEGRLEDGARRELASTRISEERFRTLVQNATDTVAILDRSGTFTYCSPAVDRNWGVISSAVEGRTLFEVTYRDDVTAARSFFTECLERPGGTVTTELRIRTGAGTWRAAEVVGSNLLGQEPVDGVVLTVRDITDRKAFEDQLKTLAFRDLLTNLANRALFIDRLGHAMAGAERRGSFVGVLFLDLDNFKLVNDSLGHDAGDRLLVAVAERLQVVVRAEDTAARFGGDEFTILLEEVATEAEATEVATRIETALATPFTVDGHELFVTASIGIAVSRGRSGGSEALVRNADLAMYRAKRSGKAGHMMFESSMEAGAIARIDLETDLRHALERNELRVYLPADRGHGKRSHRGGGSPGAVGTPGARPDPAGRLHPGCRGNGLDRPDRPVGAGRGLPAGRHLESRAPGSGDHHGGEPVRPQFQHPGLLGDIARAVREAALDPAGLTLEITESVVMKDPVAAAAKLHEIKALGVCVAVDDFGTGYSSLAYLKDFPVDTLKIDRSFIRELGGEGGDPAIVRSVIALGHALHLEVTAEGIETAVQFAHLRTLRCDRGQGYLFARPVPADELAPLLAARIVQRPPRLAA